MRIHWSLPVALSLAACATEELQAPTDEPRAPTATPEDRIFAAVEDDGALAVLDGESGDLLRTIGLSGAAHGETVEVAVHNVQAAADGRTVWLTAMPSAEGGAHGADMPDELIGVDAGTYEVTSRIELGTGLHAAHVVISGSTAWVTANEANSVVVVDLATKSVSKTLALPDGTGPHGARLTPDGRTLVVAGMGDGSLVLLDVASGAVRRHELPGRAVQTAVLPDGSAAFATIYDTRQVARLDLSSQVLTLFALPPDSAGPLQLYPSPDSTTLWIADQGMLEGAAAGDSLVAMDSATGAILQVVKVDPGPHGVVLNADGTKAWTTTLVNGTVQAIDTATGSVLRSTPVGTKPNGITCAHEGGVMP